MSPSKGSPNYISPFHINYWLFCQLGPAFVLSRAKGCFGFQFSRLRKRLHQFYSSYERLRGELHCIYSVMVNVNHRVSLQAGLAAVTTYVQIILLLWRYIFAINKAGIKESSRGIEVYDPPPRKRSEAHILTSAPIYSTSIGSRGLAIAFASTVRTLGTDLSINPTTPRLLRTSCVRCRNSGDGLDGSLSWLDILLLQNSNTPVCLQHGCQL
jgi:hypothetical protein